MICHNCMYSLTKNHEGKLMSRKCRAFLLAGFDVWRDGGPTGKRKLVLSPGIVNANRIRENENADIHFHDRRKSRG